MGYVRFRGWSDLKWRSQGLVSALSVVKFIGLTLADKKVASLSTKPRRIAFESDSEAFVGN
jgi:hypothetical protein